MPNQAIEVTPIETFMPSVDMRNSPKVHVIDGANFIFDSQGPKSGFASAEVSPFSFSAPRDLQSIKVEEEYFIFTQDAMLQWNGDYFDLIRQFTQPIPLNSGVRTPWVGAFMSDATYLAQAFRGLYEVTRDSVTERLVVRQRTSDHIPGLIDGIKGMAVVRNRMILVNDTTIQWSNTGDMSDLTPGPGGAGFVAINAFTKGTFVALADFEDGFIVYTTQGSVIAEFIGGTLTWRWYPGESLERPINSWCIQRIASGVHGIMTPHGLFTVTGGQDPQPWTPEFNEFFLKYIVDLVPNQSLRWRLEYDFSRQTIYVMESNDDLAFWRAFVLTPTRNKWGIFSKRHYGWLTYSDDLYGFMGLDAIPRYLTDGLFELVEPDNARGKNRCYPRFEKSALAQTLSSSVVCRNHSWDFTNPIPFVIPVKAAWYAPNSNNPSGASLGSLDSWIDLGFIRAPQLGDTIDAIPEIQEIKFGSEPRLPDEHYPSTNWIEDKVFWEEEDWNWDGLVGTEDIVEDLNLESGFEDMNTSENMTYDFNFLVKYIYDDSGVPDEDWNIEDGAEDWNGQFAHLNPLKDKLTILSSEDGYTFQEFEPYLALFLTHTRTLTLVAPGYFHRMRIEANEPYAYYHVRFLGFTFEYGGQLI